MRNDLAGARLAGSALLPLFRDPTRRHIANFAMPLDDLQVKRGERPAAAARTASDYIVAVRG